MEKSQRRKRGGCRGGPLGTVGLRRRGRAFSKRLLHAPLCLAQGESDAWGWCAGAGGCIRGLYLQVPPLHPLLCLSFPSCKWWFSAVALLRLRRGRLGGRPWSGGEGAFPSADRSLNGAAWDHPGLPGRRPEGSGSKTESQAGQEPHRPCAAGPASRVEGPLIVCRRPFLSKGLLTRPCGWERGFD